MSAQSGELFRIDPLTGCNNFLSFVETLDHLSSIERKPQFSIIYVDMNYLDMLNKTKGHSYGDTALRWLEIVLREESNAPTYRIGGDEFTVLLSTGTFTDHGETLNRIFTRLNKESGPLGIPNPAARIALIHYEDDANLALNNVLYQLGEAIMYVKTKKDRTYKTFYARDLMGADPTSRKQEKNEDIDTQETLHWIASFAINRLVFLGRMLNKTQQAAFTDSISGLPNLRAALLNIEKEMQNSSLKRESCSILLIDGDNIRSYNDISYAVGDEMIRDLSTVLSGNLRPGDFVARWRSGDEFIAVLPNTGAEGARIVGERFRQAVKDASQLWRFPTSISIGIATYPMNGQKINPLIDKAEAALKRAKDEGKDRVIVAG
jgi:diguanylate cyclase (GGDEF)-like protein